MKTSYLFLSLAFFFIFCKAGAQSKSLYETVVALDSTYFTAYNNCDMQTQAAMYSDSIEFYHDKGGLNTSKKALLKSIEENICGKVTRELVKGSIEVSPIPGYGAVEIGMHMFHNKQEKDAIPHPSRFIIIWHESEGKWTMTRVISLH